MKPLSPHSDEFRSMADTLRHDLFVAATEGRVTSLKPVTAKRIIERYKTLHPEWMLRDGSQVRELVNFLRSHGEKIGSNTQGYWYMLNNDGAEHVANQLESRMAEILSAYKGMFPEKIGGLSFRLNSALTHGKGQQTIFQ